MKQRLIKTVFEDNVVMNWSTVQKCSLILVLACGMHLTWIIWKLYIFFQPQYWFMINLPIFEISFWVDVIGFAVFSLLLIPTLYYRDRSSVQLLIPWLSIGLFTLSLCHASYLVGTLSPATMIGYVSIVGVGLVLFQRHLIYIAMIPASVMLLGCTFLSSLGMIPYAPLFNIEISGKPVFIQPFWVNSMLFFSIPVFLTCLLLFEILLTQWRNREEYIQRLSQIDPLTCVLNRRSINLCLQTLHDKSRQSNCCYAIILLDLDHFKQVNDRYGHHIGDEVLVKVAACLSSHLRHQDYIGRFGGEEFILLLPNTPLKQVQNIAERCRIAIQKLSIRLKDQNEIRISASFGIAISQFGADPKEILKQADQALYAVKAMGRNQVQCFFDLPQQLS